MREEQFRRLDEIQERLLDAILIEADPINWPGGDQKPGEMTKEDRGNRYWCKKNANASIALLNRTLSLAQYRVRFAPEPRSEDYNEAGEPEDELSAEIAAAEKEAAAELEAFQKRHGLTVVK